MILSVILPVHNTAKYLPKCIESIVKQGLDSKDFEIIVVENASTDNSLAVCHRLKELFKDNEITIIHTDEPGVGNARNLGIQSSHGEYIHFVDSDDWIEDGMYLRLMSENDKRYDLLVTGIRNDFERRKQNLIDEVPSGMSICENNREISNFLSQMDAKQKVWALNVIWNKWYKAELLRKYGLCFRKDINLGEDFIFNCSYFEKLCSMKVVSVAYYHYMHRGTVSLVNKFRTDVLYRRPIIYAAYCKLYGHYGILKSNQRKIDLLEGKLLFGSLYSIFNKDCDLSFVGKINFLKQNCESDYFIKFGLPYLKSSNMVYHKLLYSAILYKKYRYVYLLLHIKLILKRNK